MPTFPSYVKIGSPLEEAPASVVLRSEMERGVPKQRRFAADTLVEQQVTLYFETKQDSIDWETWFYTTINGGVDFFDWPDQRSGTTVQARVKNGQLGPLKLMMHRWAYSQRTLTLEWLRSAL